jgi:hypothetical protein
MRTAYGWSWPRIVGVDVEVGRPGGWPAGCPRRSRRPRRAVVCRPPSESPPTWLLPGRREPEAGEEPGDAEPRRLRPGPGPPGSAAAADRDPGPDRPLGGRGPPGVGWETEQARRRMQAAARGRQELITRLHAAGLVAPGARRGPGGVPGRHRPRRDSEPAGGNRLHRTSGCGERELTGGEPASAAAKAGRGAARCSFTLRADAWATACSPCCPGAQLG